MARNCFTHLCFFSSFLFVLLCVPLSFAVPINPLKTPYSQFVESLLANSCEIPSGVKLPFKEFRPEENAADLSPYLKICNSNETLSKEASVLCGEVFAILQNISCSYQGTEIPDINVTLSDKVCVDIGSLQFSKLDIGNTLLSRLTDNMVCSMLCDGDFEKSCQLLLWSFQVQHDINAAIAIGSMKPNIVPNGTNGDVVKGNQENEPKKAEVDNNALDENIEQNSNVNQKNNQHLAQSSTTQLANKMSSSNPLQVSQQNIQIDKNATQPGQKMPLSDVPQQASDQPPAGIFPSEDTLLAKDEGAQQHKELGESHLKPENLDDPHDAPENNFNDDLANAVVNTEQKEIPPVLDTKLEKSEGNALKPEILPKTPTKGTVEIVHQAVINSETTKGITPSLAGSTNTQTQKNLNVDKISNPTVDQKSTVKTETTVKATKSESKTVPLNVEEATTAVPKLSSTDLILPSEKAKENTKNKDAIPEEYNDLENNEDDAEYLKQDYVGGTNDLSKTVSNNPEENTKSKNPVYSRDEEFSSRNMFPREGNDIQMIAAFPDQEDNHFFFYFLSIVLILMGGYLIFHNKQKIIALIVEGRHERRRRSHGAGYKKLETK